MSFLSMAFTRQKILSVKLRTTAARSCRLLSRNSNRTRLDHTRHTTPDSEKENPLQSTLKEQLGELLRLTAETLDIPDHLYEDAVLKYEDVGAWLAAEGSELHRYSPEIYPQGSFRLGTMIKPFTKKDEYDIDLVCHLQINKERTTQTELKERVGDRLKKRPDIAEIMEECRRCWSLDYPRQFHMDVLPAIPNVERPSTGILLTDTELRAWQRSNPKLYAEWFYGRMRIIFEEKRTTLAKSYQMNVEEVPEWQVKTPLQRAVQVLKRHRDIHFQNNQDNSPVSIIITTLAAKAYRNQGNLYDALLDIVRDMPKFIENRNGEWWVPNPVDPGDPGENFANKWNEKPERRLAFFTWLKKVESDFTSAIQGQTLQKAVDVLSPVMGRDMITKAAASLGLNLSSLPAPQTRNSVNVPALADASHCQQPLWPGRKQYKATVKGAVYPKLRYTKKLWALADRPVPKRIALRFEVTTNAPYPYEVHWQVVNTGEEARRDHGLRGDFYNGEGTYGRIRWEETAYTGTHWVEAFVVKDGVCVAQSGRKLVRIRG